MKTQTKIHAILMAFLLTGAFLSQATQAASQTCDGTKKNGQIVTATLGDAIACEGLEEGNLAHKAQDLPLDVFGMEWVLIEKDVEAGNTPGALSFTDTSGNSNDSKSGTWSIDTSKTGLYNSFVIGLKPDGMSGYWNVGSVVSGTYSALSHGLSHGNLYGKTVIPVPAALWLFGSGMIGLVGFARRKSAKS